MQAREIISIVVPTPRFPEEIYYALLSSLAKAILLQAEIEVTAEKRTAVNLAQLAVALLSELNSFAEIFWAKLVQRTGGWAIPVVIPGQDIDGSDLQKDQVKRRKVMGYVDAEETNADYSARVAGIMRVYFHIIMTQHPKMLGQMFSASRYWTYFARMVKDPSLLLSAVAPELLYGTYSDSHPISHLCSVIVFSGSGSWWCTSAAHMGRTMGQAPRHALCGSHGWPTWF